MKKKNNLNLLYILKDEGETIQESIESFHDNGNPVYDRLVIAIDNSTSDDTLEKVRPYTKEISFFKWEEDFAKHRNEVISKIKTGKNEFIMFPDGHEVLRSTSAFYNDQRSVDSLQSFLEGPPEYNGNVPTNLFATWIEIDVDEWDIPHVLFFRPLFFRNTGKVYFKRAVHNHLWDEEGPSLKIPQISFIHNMPSKRKVMRKKMRANMNKRGFQKVLKQNPKDLRSIFYYAETLDEMNDLDQALHFYKKAFKMSDQKDKDMSTQICISTMNLLCRFENYSDAILWGFRGMRNNWNRAEVYNFMGTALIQLQRYDEAIHWFEKCTKMRLPLDTYFFLMGKVYSWLPWDGLMYCKNKIGDLEGSLEAAKKVLSYKPNEEMTLHNIKNLEEAIKDRKAKELLSNISMPEEVSLLDRNVVDPDSLNDFKPIPKELIK